MGSVVRVIRLGVTKMKILNVARVVGAFIALAIGTAAYASPPPATWTDLASDTSPLTIPGVTSGTLAYSPGADEVWYYNGNITPQNSSSIKGVVETQFGLTTGSLTAVSQCDSPISGCINATATNSGSGNTTYHFSSTKTFDYLALHGGQWELLFHFSAPTTNFYLGVIPTGKFGMGGLSNYRSYTASSLTPVPEPETYAMLLAGLGLLGFVARRRTH